MQTILHQGGYGDVAGLAAASLPLALVLVLLLVVLISNSPGAAMEPVR